APLVHPVAPLLRAGLLDAHARHVHRVREAHGGAFDGRTARVADVHADGVLSDLGRPGRHGDRDHDIADTPFLLPGTRLTAHLHRPGALHLPVAHADGAHHPHHSLGRLDLAFGVDEAVGAGHDAFPGGEAVQHAAAVVKAAAELH